MLQYCPFLEPLTIYEITFFNLRIDEIILVASLLHLTYMALEVEESILNLILDHLSIPAEVPLFQAGELAANIMPNGMEEGLSEFLSDCTNFLNLDICEGVIIF